MKILLISKNTLEIAKVQLLKPVTTIGRSPVCDVNLRAKGVRPVQFIVEWLGAGKFDPSTGQWALLDLSLSQSDDFKQGAVLTAGSLSMGGYQFSCVEDRFETKEQIGGRIRSDLTSSSKINSMELLELVQLREDSGAVEEVLHLNIPKKTRLRRAPLAFMPQMDLQWQKEGTRTRLLLKVDKMRDAQIFNKGQRLETRETYPVLSTDVFQVRWGGREVFARFVDRVEAPKVRHSSGDPLLRMLAMVVLFIAAGFFFLIQFAAVTPEKEPGPPPRVAKIEIKKAPEPEPPQPKEPEPARPPREPPQAAKNSAPQPVKIPKKAQTAKAAAPRFDSPQGESRIGLNSPAKPADVNSIGILGALSKSQAKGTGVSADRILNDGITTQAVAQSEGSTGIVVRNSPSGEIGAGTGGTSGARGPGLQGASTTLKGAGKGNAESGGPIAVRGGASGYQLGSGLVGDGTGVGGGTGLGSVDGTGFQISGGGLDKETVRRIIASYRNQIRTCYERALLTSTSLNGRVVYDWSITPVGNVHSARIVSSSLQSSALQPCVLEIIEKMRFPKATNNLSTKVIYPFVFHGKN